MAPRGLGDVVERFAQPVAKVIDEAFGTDVQNCKSCKEVRKPFLNKIVPDVKHPLRRK
jgi:hypothetical protein